MPLALLPFQCAQSQFSRPTCGSFIPPFPHSPQATKQLQGLSLGGGGSDDDEELFRPKRGAGAQSPPLHLHGCIDGGAFGP